jgi:hypothetical protein
MPYLPTLLKGYRKDIVNINMQFVNLAFCRFLGMALGCAFFYTLINMLFAGLDFWASLRLGLLESVLIVPPIWFLTLLISPVPLTPAEKCGTIENNSNLKETK